MKKLNLFTAVIVAATIFSSCSKDESNPGDGEPTRMVVRMSTGSADGLTRAETVAVDVNDPVSFLNGYLYFAAGTQITDRVKIITTGTPDNKTEILYSELTGGSGVTIENIKASATNAYFIGNVPAGVTLPSGGNISSVLATMASINSQSDANGGVVNVSLYGSGTVDTPVGWTDEDPKEVAFRVYPISARIQIPFFTVEGAVTGFQVDGIFMNYFYHQARVDGTTHGDNFITYGSTDNWVPGGETYFGTGTPNYTGITFDYNATAGLGDFESTNKKYYPNPSDLDRLWAYNLLAGGNAPHIIIKLSGITTNDGSTYADPQYITVKGINDGSVLTTITGGKIYTFTGGIPVHQDYLTPLPEMDEIDVEVDITIMPWEDVSVTPEI